MTASSLTLPGTNAASVRWVPSFPWSLGSQAVELAEKCGLTLDGWQRDVVEGSLGVGEAGKFAAFEVGVNVARQNGKGAILEARELASIFMLDDRLVIHSSHEFPTSMTAMTRMEELLEEGGFIRELRPRGGVSRSHGSEGFLFRSGQRIWYRTRTKGGGRGFSADLVVLDEAMVLQLPFHAALLPTVSGRTEQFNPQVWYTGSPVDQLVHDHGLVFANVRARGLAKDPSLAYWEWSAFPPVGEDGLPVTPDTLTDEDLEDRDGWRRANPALGLRISEEHVARELRSLDARSFAGERLGVGDWPRTDEGPLTAIAFDDWQRLADPDSMISGDLVFAFDVTPDRSKASIVSVGPRPDGKLHVELVAQQAGTNWVVPELARLVERWRPRLLVRDSRGPVASLKTRLEEARLDVLEVSTSELAEACGRFADAVADGELRHLGQREFEQAIKGSSTRPLGDAWAWARRSSKTDISPLVAATIGFWAADQKLATVYEDRGVLAV